MRYGWITCCWVVVLLLVLFSGAASSRRGGRRGGSSGSNQGSPSHGGVGSLPKSSSNKQSQAGGGHGAKTAGLAAVGAAVGYGLSSLGKSHYSQGGQRSPSAGKEAGQPRFQGLNLSPPAVRGKLHSQALKGPCPPAFSLLVCGLTASLFQS